MFRLGVDTTIFRAGFIRQEPDGGDPRDFDAVSVGIGLPQAGLNFGGSIANGLVFGARVTIGLNEDDQIFEDDSYLLWSVLPYLEFIFMRRVFRPFLTVIVGAEGVGRYRDDDTWWWGFKALGGGGFHFFVHRHVSIDLTLLAGFVGGGGELNNNDFHHRRFTTQCLLGVSGWF